MTRKIGVILPHTRIFGGVKRFLEIGNLLLLKGHSYTVFTPEGLGPDWFPFKGEVQPLSRLQEHSFDALFISENEYIPLLKTANTRLRIFYAVLERPYIRKILKEEGVLVFANSVKLYNYLNGDTNTKVIKAIGGIDLNKFAFRPKQDKKSAEPFIVMAYGRFYRKKKGTMMVVKACERLYKKGYNIKLHLFDTPVDEESRRKVENFKCKVPFQFFVDYPVKDVAQLYYQADVFVSAERNAGWCNTGAESMACGTPLIATTSGTKDFLFDEETGLVVWRFSFFIERAIKRFYNDKGFYKAVIPKARKKIEEFSWDNLAAIIERNIEERL